MEEATIREPPAGFSEEPSELGIIQSAPTGQRDLEIAKAKRSGALDPFLHGGQRQADHANHSAAPSRLLLFPEDPENPVILLIGDRAAFAGRAKQINVVGHPPEQRPQLLPEARLVELIAFAPWEDSRGQ